MPHRCWISGVLVVALLGCLDDEERREFTPTSSLVALDDRCRPCGGGCPAHSLCMSLDVQSGSPSVCAPACRFDDDCTGAFGARAARCVQLAQGADGRLHAGSPATACQGGDCTCLTAGLGCPHRCVAGRWLDCNGGGGTDADGCERDVGAPGTCGSCDGAAQCAQQFSHGQGTCGVDGTCRLLPGACDPGWGDCDGLAANGCETDLRSDLNCGSCNHACALTDHVRTTCSGNGQCIYRTTMTDAGVVLACEDGFADCQVRECPSTMGANEQVNCQQPILPALDATRAGCETLLGTSSHCGGCGDLCVGSAEAPKVCGAGVCVASDCELGWARCGGVCVPLGLDGRCSSCADDCSQGPASQAPGKCCVQVATPAGSTPTEADCVPLAIALQAAGSDTSLQATAVAQLACHAFACQPGWANCDNSPDGSCETHLATDTHHCGSCANDCAAEALAWQHVNSATCGQGQCSFSCAAGYTTCGTDSVCLVQLGSNQHCSACGDTCMNGMTCEQDECQCPPGQVACPESGSLVCRTPGVDFCALCGDLCLASNACQQGLDGGLACAVCPGGGGYCVAGQGCTPLDVVERCGSCDNDCTLGPPAHVSPTLASPSGVQCLQQVGKFRCAYSCAPGWLDCQVGQSGCESSAAVWPNCGSCQACALVKHIAPAAQQCLGGSKPCAAWQQGLSQPELHVVASGGAIVQVPWSSGCAWGYFDCNSNQLGAPSDGCECRTGLLWDKPPPWVAGCSVACKGGQCSCDDKVLRQMVCADVGNKCL
jgi:hypothetical protein